MGLQKLKPSPEFMLLQQDLEDWFFKEMGLAIIAFKCQLSLSKHRGKTENK